MKHYNKKLNLNSLIASSKEKNSFKTLNHFNYELMRSTFLYKSSGSIIGLFKLFCILGQFRYKTYMVSFYMYDLVFKNLNNCLRGFLILLYSFMTMMTYFYYFDLFYFHSPKLNTEGIKV